VRVQNEIAIDVLQEAQSIVNAQRFVPLSPAEFDADGSACLCAAGILAKAGLQVLRGESEAKIFEIEVARTKNSNLLHSTFASLGWPAELCTDMVRENDATDSTLRKDVIRLRLSELGGSSSS
jgi:hypothetical protein